MEKFLQNDALLTLDDMLSMPTELIDELLEENERMKRERESVRYREFKHLSLKPQLVLDCIEYLRLNQSTMQEGLFRIPGTNSVVEEIRKAYAKQQYEDVLSIIPDVDANVVATTLKSYFRLLEEPLIPNESYERLMDLGDAITSAGATDSQIAELKAEIVGLASPNKEILCYLMIFFKEVVANQDINMMKPNVLATCVSPSLMRYTGETKKETGKMMAIMELGISIKMLTMMIEEIDFMEIIGEDVYEDIKSASKYQLRGEPTAPQNVNRHNVTQALARGNGPPPPVPDRKKGPPPPGLGL
eukprot:CAMPEP_0184017730 /NCGR_PEP_ID=MMETSP0954-20121128/7719_1 /TAXON_ID=627963 /ORGANISM="Aplanochytrium sp, Strain PBS07" /LENGTH=301 /DNA_ID=CAMNT_0026299039 /DNA_START=376 /DNA_END=1281 /DNA_ORIENTATION=+